MAYSTKFIFCLFLVTWTTPTIADEILDAANDDTNVKRSISGGTAGLSAEDKTALLDLHNQMRSQQKSSNMLKMDWDPALERAAQNYAQVCKWKHSLESVRTNFAGYTNVGENIYATSGPFVPANAIKKWYDEVNFYDYNTQKCAQEMCGHYTQMVFANSKTLGCGIKHCDKLEGAGFGGYFLVCQYGTGQIDGKPFMLGDACSACPNGQTMCVNGLCA